MKYSKMTFLPLISKDSLSDLSFSHIASSENLLSVSSWDSTVTIYDTEVLQEVV